MRFTNLVYCALFVCAAVTCGAQTNPHAELRSYVNFAMSHEGDVARGKELFSKGEKTMCWKCHTADGTGGKAWGGYFYRNMGQFARRGWYNPRSPDAQTLDAATMVFGPESIAGKLGKVERVVQVAEVASQPASRGMRIRLNPQARIVGGWNISGRNAGRVSRGNKYLAGKTPNPGTRGTGVRRAAQQEVELVRTTGKGTINWTQEEIEFIRNNNRLPPGTVGHHINNVEQFPTWAGDPRNISFVRGQPGNLAEHGGNFQNPTTGPLIDREALIKASTNP